MLSPLVNIIPHILHNRSGQLYARNHPTHYSERNIEHRIKFQLRIKQAMFSSAEECWDQLETDQEALQVTAPLE